MAGVQNTGQETIPGEEKLPDKLVVSSNLLKAYLVHTLGDLAVIGTIYGAYYLVSKYGGLDLFSDMFDLVGIPMSWAFYAFIIFAALLFVVTFFKVMNLTSYSVIFEGDTMSFSYGSILKVSKTVPITNLARVNFDLYSISKTGDLTVSFSGTNERELKLSYIDDVAKTSEIILKILVAKRSATGIQSIEAVQSFEAVQ
jgi:hypothetical protein